MRRRMCAGACAQAQVRRRMYVRSGSGNSSSSSSGGGGGGDGGSSAAFVTMRVCAGYAPDKEKSL